MADIQGAREHLAATTRASQFLTVNIVMPAVGESAKEGAGFARLIFGLAVLALERFGALAPGRETRAGHSRPMKAASRNHAEKLRPAVSLSHLFQRRCRRRGSANPLSAILISNSQ